MFTVKAVVSEKDRKKLHNFLTALKEAPERFARDIERPLAVHARNRGLAEIWRREGIPAWAKLKPATAREKVRQGWPAAILVRTKALQLSLIGPESLLRVMRLTRGNFKLVLGSKDPKFPIHHAGAPGAGIPARPMLPTDRLLRSWATEAEGGLLIPMLDEDIRGGIRK